MGSLPSPSRDNPQFLNRQIYTAFRPKNLPRSRAKTSIDISSYRPYNNTWNYITSIPDLDEDYGRKEFIMIPLGDSIYVIGGLTYREEIVNGSTVDVDVHATSSVLRFNHWSGTWSACATLTHPRYEFACAVSEGKIYVAGGKSTLEDVVGLTSAEVYDPTLDTWTSLPDMRAPRYKCVGVMWEGRIHVVGGFGGVSQLNFAPERSSAEAFDTQARKWYHVAGMWQLDIPPNQIVVVNGRLFSSGDCLKIWKGHVEAYDWTQNMWNEVEGSRLQSLEGPTSSGTHTQGLSPQLYLTIAPIGTYLYFLVGYKVDGQTLKTKSIVHRFDTSTTTDCWTSFDPTEEEGEKLLCSHCCVVQLQ